MGLHTRMQRTAKCPDCGSEMRPLAVTLYCPNDCDRPKVVAPPDIVQDANIEWTLDNLEITLAPESAAGDIDWDAFVGSLGLATD